MAAKSSIARDIIWNWVIEALATYKQADASTLVGLVKRAPAISGDLGKDTRDVVSFRILESLFLQGDEAVVGADEGQNGKISFDSSERCENVLHQILRETPEHSARLEKEKWDVGPFLTHKRSSLPTCVLKKLKEVILESSNPLLTPLKEMSKLGTPNVSENTIPMNDDNFDVQDSVAKDDSHILNSRKDKDKFQEKELQETDDQVGNAQHDQQQLHINDENSPKDTYEKRVSVDSLENAEFAVKSKEKSVEPNASDNEHLSKENNFMEDDDDPPERIDDDETDSVINVCVKCNNSDDELLVCSSDACPLHVHERCLGFTPTLDENGNFFCPFCAYSRAISKYQEAKRKASQAKSDLQTFSGFRVKRRPNESSKKQSEFEKNEDRLDETTEENVAKEHVTQGEGKKKVNDKVKVKVNESNVVSGRHVDKDIENLTQEPSTPKRKRKEKESQRSNESSCSRELRKMKRKPQYTPPTFPLSRRKIIPWTKSEEETLKKGVERDSSVDDKGIPWKEILDFGHNVFHKGRTSIDLKDKWRNICKKTKEKLLV